MKRFGFCLAFFVSLGVSVFAQSGTPIIGYDKVTWGSTVQTVTQAYTGLREVPSDKASVGVKEFEQTNVGSGISDRTFFFYENKLYRVSVTYNDVSKDTTSAILDRIEAIYGPFDRRSGPRNSVVDGTMGSHYQYLRNFNRNLTIVVNLLDIYNQFNFHLASGVRIVYYDEPVRDRIDEALRKQRADKIQL